MKVEMTKSRAFAVKEGHVFIPEGAVGSVTGIPRGQEHKTCIDVTFEESQFYKSDYTGIARNECFRHMIPTDELKIAGK